MNISLKQEQKQILSQKIFQSAEILQMTALAMQEYLTQQALDNPVLELTEKKAEEPEDKTLEKYEWISSHDEQNRYLYQWMENGKDDLPEWNIASPEDKTLAAYLWSQLIALRINPKEKSILRFMVNNLDNRGYYPDPLEECAHRFQTATAKIQQLLTLVQGLEPPGVGARNLQECLSLQLTRQNLMTPLLQRLVTHYLPQIAKNQLEQIVTETKIPLAELKEMCKLIRSLEPEPGRAFSGPSHQEYVVPDVFVELRETHFQVILNEAIYPDVALNNYYLHMYHNPDNKEVRDYLRDKIRQAIWIKQCLAQRQNTLLTVVQTIASLQQDFFFNGPDCLKPLRITEVAEIMSVHISTVSRACRQKYLQCSWGMFPLKYFFAKAAIKKQAFPKIILDDNQTGLSIFEDSSAQAVTVQDVQKALISIIAQEDKKKPYSDRVLAELLTKQGFPLARRTVAKYREQLNIPGTSGRKEY